MCAEEIFNYTYVQMHNQIIAELCKALALGTVADNQKWKFKMVFAMKGGGGARGGLGCHIRILKNDFFENHLESIPCCKNVFALSLGFIVCIYSS